MAKKLKLDWDPEASPVRNARSRLPRLVRTYFDGGRELVSGTSSPQDLHAFRLQTKRLRYSLELFRPCYGPGLNKRLDDLRMVQQLLGDINDCVASQKLLPELKAFLEELAAKRIVRFTRHWRREFDKPGAQDAWERYLKKTRK